MSNIKQPEIVAFQLKLSQNRPIYESFKMMHDGSLWDTFTEAQRRIIDGNWFCPVHFFLNSFPTLCLQLHVQK